MTGSFQGLRLEGADPSGQNSHWFIIKRPGIWDYRWLHSSIPFPAKNEICLIPHSGAASEGVQGGLASITGPKKGQNIRNQEGGSGSSSQGRRPVGQWTRGAGSDQAEGDATWPKITAASGNMTGPAACVCCSGGKWRAGVLTLVSELESQRGKDLLPTKSLLTALDCQDWCLLRLPALVGLQPDSQWGALWNHSDYDENKDDEQKASKITDHWWLSRNIFISLMLFTTIFSCKFLFTNQLLMCFFIKIFFFLISKKCFCDQY